MNAGNTRQRIKGNQSGVVLFSVVVMSMIVMILIVAIMTFVSTASKQSTANYSDEQAYYIASSSLKTFVDYVNSVDYSGDSITNLAAANASGNVRLNNNTVINGTGRCRISVGYANPSDTDIIVVKAESTYVNQSAQAVAYFKASKVPQTKKISNAIEAGGGATFVHAANAIGNIFSKTEGTGFVDNALKLNNKNSIYGTLHNEGNIIIMQAQSNGTDSGGWHDNIDGSGSYIAATGSIVIGTDGECTFSPTKAKTSTSGINDYNYIAAGKYFVGAGNVSIGATAIQQMDVYCQAAYLGGFTSSDDASHEFSSYTGGTGGTSYKQFGNLYCYKASGDTSAQNGSLIIGSQNGDYSPKVNGNVYVDGNIYIMGRNSGHLTINGDLYITKDLEFFIGTSTGSNNKIELNGKIYCDLSSLSTTEKTALKEKLTNWITVDSSEMDGSLVKINNTTIVKAGRNEKPVVEFQVDQFDYASTADILSNAGGKLNGTIFETYQTNLDTLRTNNISTKKISDMTAEEKNATGVSADLNNFKYYTKENCYVDVSDGNIFVDVDSAGKDVILLFPSSFSIESKTIVVKNSTKHFCYLVVDDKDTTRSFSFLQSKLLDYNLYKNLTDLQSETGMKALNATAYYDDSTNPGVVKNDINNAVMITPSLVKTVLMVPQGTTVQFGNGNVLVQALLYGPDATLDINATGGMYLATDINYTTQTCIRKEFTKIGFIGSSIFHDYDFEESEKAIFMATYPGSVIEMVNGGGSKTIVDFDHYEIR